MSRDSTHAALPSRPRPAYAADTPLACLSTAELLPVGLLRLWIAAALEPEAGFADWRAGAKAAGLRPAGVAGFEGFWRVVAATPCAPGRAPLDLRCPCDGRLGADEGWFLQALRALQAGEEAAAASILAGWMPPAGVRLALSPLTALAEALRQAGLVLPDRPEAPPPLGAPLLTACPDPGLRLLH